MMGLPDPTTIRTDPIPDGWRYEWVPEPVFGWLSWRVISPEEAKRCRWTDHGIRCENQSVAKLNRGRKDERWWHYCADHMFGRRIDGRRVWVIHTIEEADRA